MSDITIIILSFNTKELTLRAVRSCFQGDAADIHVVVVDNASTDGSPVALKAEAAKNSHVSVVLRDVNDGFSAGNNVALAKVKTKYCMLLNSDAYFEPGNSVREILDYMDVHEDVAVVTPHVILQNDHTDPASHRGFPTPWNAFSYYSGLEKIIGGRWFGGYHQTWKDIHTLHEVDACTGAAMVIRTSAMKEVGILDEQFFMYGEDLDWCFRFKEKGWKIIFFPTVLVRHDKHTSGIKKVKYTGHTESSLSIQKQSRDAFYDAMRLFYRKHYKHVYPAFVQAAILVGIELVRKMKRH